MGTNKSTDDAPKKLLEFDNDYKIAWNLDETKGRVGTIFGLVCLLSNINIARDDGKLPDSISSYLENEVLSAIKYLAQDSETCIDDILTIQSELPHIEIAPRKQGE